MTLLVRKLLEEIDLSTSLKLLKEFELIINSQRLFVNGIPQENRFIVLSECPSIIMKIRFLNTYPVNYIIIALLCDHGREFNTLCILENIPYIISLWRYDGFLHMLQIKNDENKPNTTAFISSPTDPKNIRWIHKKGNIEQISVSLNDIAIRTHSNIRIYQEGTNKSEIDLRLEFLDGMIQIKSMVYNRGFLCLLCDASTGLKLFHMKDYPSVAPLCLLPFDVDLSKKFPNYYFCQILYCDDCFVYLTIIKSDASQWVVRFTHQQKTLDLIHRLPFPVGALATHKATRNGRLFSYQAMSYHFMLTEYNLKCWREMSPGAFARVIALAFVAKKIIAKIFPHDLLQIILDYC